MNTNVAAASTATHRMLMGAAGPPRLEPVHWGSSCGRPGKDGAGTYVCMTRLANPITEQFMRTGTVLLLVAVAAIFFFDTPSASSPKAETFEVDPVHSVVIFRIKHLNVSAFYGRFNEVKGSFTVDDGGAGAVDITIVAASVDTANARRDGHLKSPDFFSAKQFPEITFKSKSLKKLEGNRYEAKGTLSLHGVSKEITVALERIGSGEAMNAYRTGFEGTFTIKRSDFGMKWRLDMLGDEIRVIMGIEGMRK